MLGIHTIGSVSMKWKDPINYNEFDENKIKDNKKRRKVEENRMKIAQATAPKVFRKNMSKLMKTTSSADCELQLKNKTLAVHKIIIREHSEYLRKQLETNPKLIDLRPLDCDSHHVISLIKYMYTGKLRGPNKGEEMALMRTAKKLGIKEAVQVVGAYMATYLKPIDAFKLIGLALENDNVPLFQVCAQFIEFDSDTLFDVKSEETMHVIMNWPLKMIRHFVTSGTIAISEIDNFTIAKRYVEENADQHGMEPKEMFKKYFEEYIKYPLMEPEQLASTIVPLNWVDHKYIAEAFKYMAISETHRDSIKSPRTIRKVTKRGWTIDATSKAMLALTNGGRTLEKTSSQSNWNSMAYVQLHGGKSVITVHVDKTNSDRSGLSFGIIGQNTIGQPASYSAAIGTQYHKPSTSTHGNPVQGSTYKFVVNMAQDTIQIYLNGTLLGTCASKPSSLVKPLYLGAFLYYKGNKITVS